MAKNPRTPMKDSLKKYIEKKIELIDAKISPVFLVSFQSNH